MKITELKNETNIKKKPTMFQKKDKIQLVLLCIPAAVFLLIFNYIPMGGLIVAFKDYRADLGFLGSKWIGFKNFEFFFTSDIAWRITRNTVLYNLAFIASILFISILFALLLNEISKKMYIKIYQTILFLPYFISWVVASFMLYAFLEPKLGYLNRIILDLGFQPPDWYFDDKCWPFIFILANIWKYVGYNTIIYYAAILGINQEYYEAAALDGATKLQMVTNITLPSLMPLISMLTLISIGRIFNANFDMFFNLPKDNGLLYNTTDVIDTYVYRALRVTGDTGMAIAAGFYQSVVGFVLVLVSNFIVSKTNEENAVF